MSEQTSSDINAQTQFPDHDNEISIKPVPKWLKLTGTTLVAIFVIIAVVIFMTPFFADEKSMANGRVELESSVESPKNIRFSSLEENLGTDLPIPVYPKNTLEDLPDPNDDSHLTPVKTITENQKTIEQLQEQLSQLTTDTNDRQDNQDALIKDLEAQLKGQSLKIEQLQAHSKALRRTFKRNNKVVRAYKPTQIPFALISIDQWGDEYYAVIRSQGQLYELTNGQGIKGWSVSTFDLKRGTVTFKNGSGTQKELLIQS